MKNTDHLELPRILYRGPDDKGAIPSVMPPTALDRVLADARDKDQLAREALERADEPTETCRVESREELEAKLADGWRLHRTLDKDEAKDADANAAEAIDPGAKGKPAAGRKAGK